MELSLLTSPSGSSLASTASLTGNPLSGSSVSSCASPAPAIRRSVTLNIPKNVSAFIRSQRAISTRDPVRQQGVPEEGFISSYSDHHRTMELQRTKSASRVDERPPQKQYKNKFYNFLRRSRSRSRSRSKPPVEPLPPPELPILDFTAQPDFRVMSPPPEHVDESKPPTRLPSRQLSSTTTATNTTVLPLTPTQTRRQRRYPPAHESYAAPAPVLPVHDHISSRPSTPKPSVARQKLHDLFGIPLPTSRKSSLSRPDSAELFQDHPPIPGHLDGTNSRANINGGQHFTFRPTPDLLQSPPLGRSAQLPDDRPTKERSRGFRSSTLDFFRSPKLFSTSGLQKSNSTKRFMSSPSRLPDSNPSLDLSSPLQPSISAPTTVPEPPFFMPILDNHRVLPNTGVLDASMRQNGLPESPLIYTPDAETPGAADTVPPSAMFVPKIIHTPPTPAKSVEPTPPSVPPSAPTHRRNISDLKSKPGVPRPLAVVGEENLLKQSEKDRGRRLERERNRWSQRFPSPKLFGVKEVKQREKAEGDRSLPQARLVIAVTQNANQGSHRPGTADSNKTGHSRKELGVKGGRSSSFLSNGRTKHGSFDFEKPLWTFGGGKAGSSVSRSGYSRSGDSLQSGISNGTHMERSVSSSHRPLENDSLYNRTPASSSNHLTPAPSTSSHATSHSNAQSRSHSLATPTPAYPVQQPGPGRPPNKPTVTAGSSLPSGIAHGSFAFERSRPPTSPVATSSRFDMGGRVDASRESYSHKMSRKGRSLDLGLGLAWAPSKVREEALLPYGRTVSRETALGDIHDLRNEPVSGAEVTNTFREVLDEASFAKFKKYVHRFDAHAIPFDGPTGIVPRVDRLLEKSFRLDDEGRRDLMDRFIRVILQNA